MRIIFLLGAAAALWEAPATAQVDHDAALWLNATVQGDIGKRFVYFLEVQPRITDDVSHLSQVIVRPAIGVRLNDRVTLFQGYAHVVEPGADGAADRSEDRTYQQLSWTLKKRDGVDFSSRTRFEQRWRSDGAGVSLRLRQMLRYEQALTRRTESVAALGTIEGFVGVKSAEWGGVEGFDQLRMFLGAEIPLSGKSTIEAGYLAQVRDAPGRTTRLGHVASLSLFVRP